MGINVGGGARYISNQRRKSPTGGLQKELSRVGRSSAAKGRHCTAVNFRFLNSRNEDVRGLCAIVAARRWPDELLKAGQGSFSDLEYPDLLAIIALYHPELAGLAAAKITPARMQKAKSHVDLVGVGALGPGGTGMMMLPF